MTDHDAIAATIRAYLATGGDGLLPDLPGAYLDLYDEVKRLRADLTDGSFYKETDIDRLQERAEKGEAERDRLRAERDALQSQCCMCGKTGLSIIEDGGPECELDDGRWVCSVNCYDRAVLNPLVAEAKRDALRAALSEIATAASGIAHDIQIGPDDEGRDIYEMALAIRDDALEAIKGQTK